MPNWIPILIVLLTQGSGAMATVHPHDLVRMLRYASQLEEIGAANEESESLLAGVTAARQLASGQSLTVIIQPGVLGGVVWPSSDLSRDGPLASFF